VDDLFDIEEKMIMRIKKAMILLLAGTLLTGTAGCGSRTVDNGQESVQEEISSAVEILDRVWDTYEEDEQFPAAGGDYDHSVMNAPGTFDLSSPEMLEMMLYVPQDQAGAIDDAALLMHIMNVNTFTAGTFHMAEGTDRQAFAKILEENIMGTQWMCGFPDRLLIAAVGEDYLLCAFGNEELMDTFQEKLLAEFQSTAILYDEAITE
jgi:hypothetical protein